MRSASFFWKKFGAFSERDGVFYSTEVKLTNGKTIESTKVGPNEILQEQIDVLIEEIIAGSELYSVETIVRGVPGTHVVDVFLDSTSGITLDQCGMVSRKLGLALETRDLFPGKYRLNVSSPGITRPLVGVRQYQKNIGRSLKVWFRDGSGDKKQLVGDLVAVSDDAITVKRSSTDDLEIPFEQISKAKIQLPW